MHSSRYTTFHFPNPLYDGTSGTFDAYELQLVGEYDDGHGGFFEEPVLSLDDLPQRWYWTIYGHVENEGAIGLMDVDTEEEGLSVLRKIGVLGWDQWIALADPYRLALFALRKRRI